MSVCLSGGGEGGGFFFLRKSPLAAAMPVGRDEEKNNAYKLLGGGANIRIGQEMHCLPYARFFGHIFYCFRYFHLFIYCKKAISEKP